MRTSDNAATWAYDGTAWGSGGGWDSASDGMLSAAYGTAKFSRMKITMNGKTHAWRLKPKYRGQITLKDAAGKGTLGATHKKALFEKDAHGWEGKQSNPWGFSNDERNGHENYVCHELQGDYRYFGGDSAHAWARFGWSMSQEYACGKLSGFGTAALLACCCCCCCCCWPLTTRSTTAALLLLLCCCARQATRAPRKASGCGRPTTRTNRITIACPRGACSTAPSTTPLHGRTSGSTSDPSTWQLLTSVRVPLGDAPPRSLARSLARLAHSCRLPTSPPCAPPTQSRASVRLTPDWTLTSSD